MNLYRRHSVCDHDDGVDAWRTTRMNASPQLAGAIRGYADYWERTGSFTLRRELPHAEGVLIVNLGEPISVTGGDTKEIRVRAGEAFVAGGHLRPALSCSTGAQAGIHVFLPLTTLRRLFGISMDQLVDRVVPLNAVFGRQAGELGDALGSARDEDGRADILDDTLASALARAPVFDRRLTRALATLQAMPHRDIVQIADDVEWSRKHLAACVRDAIGIGPRSFRRLLRFQALTGLVGATQGCPDWADLAADAGYYDQSHMIREFREFSGMSPGVYLARSLPNSSGLREG